MLLAAVPAEAVSSFRYWSYWHVATHGSSWTYAGTGPAGYRVDDGAVEGWRFVVAVPNPSAPPPRTGAGSAFDAICGSTARPAGKDRVALVVDFGTAKDAPPHETRPGGVRGTCVVVDDRSTGLEVLAQAGYDPRRDSSGLVCGLSGFPASECGVVVKQTSPTPTPTPKPSPTKPRPTKSASVADAASAERRARQHDEPRRTGSRRAPTRPRRTIGVRPPSPSTSAPARRALRATARRRSWSARAAADLGRPVVGDTRRAAARCRPRRGHRCLAVRRTRAAGTDPA